MRNQIKGREGVEWLNFWYDHADEVVGKRILIIGDSTGRQIRCSLSSLLQCPVDFFGSSAALRDIIFWNQLDCFFKDNLYTYESIIIWIGNHSRINADGNGPFEECDYIEFTEDYKRLVKYVQSKCRNTVGINSYDIVHPYIWKNSIQRKIWRKFHLRYKCRQNIEESAIVIRKNTIMEKICNDLNVPFLDICSIMQKTQFNRPDHIHYEEASNTYVCNLIIDLMDKN